MRADIQCGALQRAWAETQATEHQARRAELDGPQRAHLDTCRTCRAMVSGEARAVQQWRTATEASSQAPLPAFARIAGAVRERERLGRQHSWPRWQLRTLGGTAIAATIAVVLFVARPAGAPDERRPTGGVIAAVGAVSLGRDGGWQTIDRRTELTTGDRIETGATASLDLSRPGTAELRVSEKTELTLQSWTDDIISIRLDRGEVLSAVEHRGPGQVYQIFTPDAVVTVVGTRFVTRYQPDDGTTVTGFEGIVRVTDRNGRLIGDVHAGQTVWSRTKEPTASLAAPEPKTAVVHADPRPATSSVLVSPNAPTEGPAGVRTAGATGEQTNAGTRLLREDAPAPLARRLDPAPLPRTPPDPAQDQGTRAGDGSARERGATSPIVEAVTAPEATPAETRTSLRAEGDRLVLAGDYARAAQVYAKAIAADDGDPGGLIVDAGQSMMRAHDSAAAVALWTRYLQSYPDGLAVSAVAGRLARYSAAQSSWPDAERYWRLVIAHDATSPEGGRALEALGGRLVETGRSAEATTLLTPLANLGGPSGEVALFGLIRARAVQRRWAELRNLTKQYVKRYPSAPRRAAVDGIVAQLPAASKDPDKP